MPKTIENRRPHGSSLGSALSSRYWFVIRGWLAFSIVLTVLGILLYTVWVLAGGTPGFLLALIGLFGLLLFYSVSNSNSIATSVAWFSDPDGILLLALLFAFGVSLIAFLL